MPRHQSRRSQESAMTRRCRLQRRGAVRQPPACGPYFVSARRAAQESSEASIRGVFDGARRRVTVVPTSAIVLSMESQTTASMMTTPARLVSMLRVNATSVVTAYGRASGPGPLSHRTTHGHLSMVRGQRSRRARIQTSNFLRSLMRLPDQRSAELLPIPVVSRVTL